MNTNQLAMFEEVDHKEVEKTVIKALREYRSFKVQLENLEERKAAGLEGLYPSLRKIRPENAFKVKQMDRALKYSLNDIERRIIEMKYLSGSYKKDINIYPELGLNKDRFYELKQHAIRYIATALGII